MATLAHIPSASTRMAVTVNPGVLRSWRSAKRRSRRRPSSMPVRRPRKDCDSAPRKHRPRLYVFAGGRISGPESRASSPNLRETAGSLRGADVRTPSGCYPRPGSKTKLQGASVDEAGGKRWPSSGNLIRTKHLRPCCPPPELEKLTNRCEQTRFANEGSLVRQAVPGAQPRLRRRCARIIPYAENRFLLYPASLRCRLEIDFLRDASPVAEKVRTATQ